MSEPRRPLQTPQTRDLSSEQHRRWSQPMEAVPEETDFGGDTGVVEGPELADRRAKRPTPMRIAHLEQRTDRHGDQLAELTTTVGELGRDLGEVVGQLRELPKTVDRLARAVEDLTAERMDEMKRKKDAEAAEEQREKDDKKHAVAQRRERWTAVIKGLVGGGALIELLHRLGWL